jgi:ferredoxin
MSGTRLQINWIRCDGRGLCTELLPEVLDRDEWGYPLPRDGAPEVVVPLALEAEARTAVSSCPRLALRLVSAPS